MSFKIFIGLLQDLNQAYHLVGQQRISLLVHLMRAELFDSIDEELLLVSEPYLLGIDFQQVVLQVQDEGLDCQRADLDEQIVHVLLNDDA